MCSSDLAYDDRVGRFVSSWRVGERACQVETDPHDLRPTRVVVRHGEVLVSEVRVLSRDAKGLPEVLRMRAPSRDADVEVRLRDVAYDVKLPTSAFVLDPPSRMAREYVGR